METVDLYPTLMDLCRPRFTDTHHALDGKSLRPFLEGKDVASTCAAKASPKAVSLSVAISYWRASVSVRTVTHRLIANVRDGRVAGSVELYDLSETLDSALNLAADREELVKELLDRIR